MKALQTPAIALALVLLLLAPAAAEGSHPLYQDIVIPLAAAEQEAMDLTKPGKFHSGAMLLPAIQKIREATARMGEACTDPATDVLDLDCGAQTLAAIIRDSKSGPDESPSLGELLEQGGLSKQERLRLGSGGVPMLDRQLAALLIGLLVEMKDQGIEDAAVLDPIVGAIQAVEALDPTSKVVKHSGPSPWHIKLLKK